jgi:hypothetical protein
MENHDRPRGWRKTTEKGTLFEIHKEGANIYRMSMIRHRFFRSLVLATGVGVMVFLAGCATVPYVAGRNIASANALRLRPGEPQIERGQSNVVIDVTGEILSIPSKLLMLNLDVDRHSISSLTETNLVRYLRDNELGNVKVRLNQYAPGGEWSRLFRNKSVGWGWRYTIGLLACTFYTILPGRLFGGDNYNPYTDTISLYSDIPAVAIHEGGHAKDFASRDYKGTYAFFYGLPLLALYPEAKASGDAIGYLRTTQGSEEEKDAYKILYPAYATYVGGEFGQFTPWSTLIMVGAVIPGHIAGRIKAAYVADRPAPQTSLLEPVDRVSGTETNVPPEESTTTNRMDRGTVDPQPSDP